MTPQSEPPGSRPGCSSAKRTMPGQSRFRFNSAMRCLSSRVSPRPASVEADSGSTEGFSYPSLAAGPAQPDNAAQAANLTRSRKENSDLVLIDVGLLFDIRFCRALQGVGIELFVPPHGAPLSLLLDDVRFFPEQFADHPGEVGFVRLRHGGNTGG